MASSLAVIINPISGTGGRPETARQRAELAVRLLDARGLEPQVFVTERQGHARELTQALVAQGVATVVAWGGDGTVNEVASVLAFTSTTMAIVPSGSGNGLARELGIPFSPPDAFEVAIGGRARLIDGGELDGHLFFNIAGLGLDARVAHRFAANGLVRRGFARYLEITVKELMTYTAEEHTIAVDGGDALRVRALLVAVANSRQYGNGALIAPDARLDDGQLDIVVVGERSALRALFQIPRVFLGQLGQVSGVIMRKTTTVQITSARPVVYHVDGEPFVGGASISGRIRPNALSVMVPASA